MGAAAVQNNPSEYPKAGVGDYAMQYKAIVPLPVTPQGIEWLSFVVPLCCHSFEASQAASRQPRKEHGTLRLEHTLKVKTRHSFDQHIVPCVTQSQSEQLRFVLEEVMLCLALHTHAKGILVALPKSAPRDRRTGHVTDTAPTGY